MLQYSDARNIAQDAFDKLGIPDDAYKTYSVEQLKELDKIANDDDYLRGLILDEIANYDTSENVQSDIEDLIDNAVNDLFFMIDEISQNRYYYQKEQTLAVYNAIAESIDNIVGVEDVEVNYDPADPDVGIYDEERSIEVHLTNGATIYLNVEITEP